METKSQMINRIAELSQENAELKAYMDVNEDFKTAWEELKAENERLKREFEIESLTDNTTGETIYRSNLINNLKEENKRIIKENAMLLGQLVINDGEDATVQISKSQFDEYNKFRTRLQEIKAIAENAYCLTNYTNKDMADFAKQILQKITKAEEE